MRRKVMVVVFVILLGIGFSFLPSQSVKAESVSSGHFVDVSSRSAELNVNVYDHNLVQRTDVSIAPNSQWATDTVINTSNGMPFLRIAPDEYVAMYDVVEQSFKATI